MRDCDSGVWNSACALFFRCVPDPLCLYRMSSALASVSTLVDASGATSTTEAALAHDVIGIYFSAHVSSLWAPIAHQLTCPQSGGSNCAVELGSGQELLTRVLPLSGAPLAAALRPSSRSGTRLARPRARALKLSSFRATRTRISTSTTWARCPGRACRSTRAPCVWGRGWQCVSRLALRGTHG